MEENQELLKKYTTKIKKINNGPGAWNSLLVDIYLGDNKIGEYARNYPEINNTFYPFVQDDKEYALYSSHYTCTRVMTLPDCKDLCGEEPDSNGFCPVGYAVPWFKYEVQEVNPDDPEPYNPRHDPGRWASTKRLSDGTVIYVWPEGQDNEFYKACLVSDRLFSAWLLRNPFVEKEFNSRFGFVCGCVWGDDYSWKIQYLDLSRIKEGVLIRSERFGYIELLGGSDTLAKSISLDMYTPENPNITISCAQYFNLLDKINLIKRTIK